MLIRRRPLTRPSQPHHKPGRPRVRPGPRRPAVELLEDRCLPSLSPPAGLPVGADPATSARISAAYGQVPLSFEANQGQADSRVHFLSRGDGYALFLTPGGAVLSLQKPATPGGGLAAARATNDSTVVRMQLLGANLAAQPAGLDPLPGTSNYFVGNDPTHWHEDVPTYGRVQYQGVYPGINVDYYGNQRRLEYDFVVSPGSNPGVIRLAFQGADSMSLDRAGNLVLHTGAGDVVEQAPNVYQEVNGARRPVSGAYVLLGGGQVGFAVGAYDRSRALVIDPVLAYSTYIGGTGPDQGFGIAVDGSGDAYVAGETASADFPLQSPAQGTIGDAKPHRGDAFLMKFDPTGTHLLYSTFLGGRNEDGAFGVALDRFGSAYITGFTSSPDFPTKGGLSLPYGEGSATAFVAKFDSDGALVYSTFLGARHDSSAHAIAVDGAGDAYVTGITDTPDFPTKNPIQPSLAGVANVFVTELNPSGNGLVYSTFLGGNNSAAALPTEADEAGDGIAVDRFGNAYVMGNTDSPNFPTTAGAFQRTYGGGDFDTFVTEIKAGGSSLAYSTFLGGNDDDQGFAIAIDQAGNTYVTGSTASANFPTTPGAVQRTFGGAQTDPNRVIEESIDLGDIFVTKLNPSGTRLVYSTYLGGSDNEEGIAIAVDGGGNAYIAAHTFSTNFPTRFALQGSISGAGNGAAVVAGLNPAGSALLFSTYLGGGAFDKANAIAVDTAGNVYVAGQTGSDTFPTNHPFQGELTTADPLGANGFVTKLTDTLEANLRVSVSASANTVRVGQNLTFTITVTNLGPATATGVMLTEVLSGSLRIVSLALTQGTVTAKGNTVTANIGSLAFGASAALTVVVTPLATGTITSQASAVVNEPGQVLGLNKASQAVQVLGAIRFSPWIPDVLLFPNGRGLPHRPA